MKKKTLLLTLIISILITSISFVSADSVLKNISVLFNSITVNVNGNKISADNIVYNGTTYIPIRAISEALGADVSYIDKTKTANINMLIYKDAEEALNDVKMPIEIAKLYVSLSESSDLIASLQNFDYDCIIDNFSTYCESSQYVCDAIDYDIKQIENLKEKYPEAPNLMNMAIEIKDTLISIKHEENKKIILFNDILKTGKDNFKSYTTIIDNITDMYRYIGIISSESYYGITNMILDI